MTREKGPHSGHTVPGEKDGGFIFSPRETNHTGIGKKLSFRRPLQAPYLSISSHGGKFLAVSITCKENGGEWNFPKEEKGRARRNFSTPELILIRSQPALQALACLEQRSAEMNFQRNEFLIFTRPWAEWTGQASLEYALNKFKLAPCNAPNWRQLITRTT